MAYVLVGEISQAHVTFKQPVHASGGRMSLPAVIAQFLGKGHLSRLFIEIKDGTRWVGKTVTLESGREIIANGDQQLVRMMKPGRQLTIRAHR